MNYIKYAIAVLVGVAIGFVGYGALHSPRAGSVITNNPGELQSSARIAQIAINGQGSTPTTTANTSWGSILNTDARDRIITSVDFAVTGLESSNNLGPTLIVATSSQAATTTWNATVVNVALKNQTQIFGVFPIATANSTTTPQIWPAGGYINIIASSTAIGATTTTNGAGVVKINFIAE